MRWIILALSLGAAVTSIIHGVFMLFGALSGGLSGDMSLITASLPLISSLLVLIGGFVAFHGYKWGGFFLILATALCAFSPREVWLYGGIYFIAAILCVFVKRREEFDNYRYDSGQDEDDFEFESDADDYDYDGGGRGHKKERAAKVSRSAGLRSRASSVIRTAVTADDEDPDDLSYYEPEREEIPVRQSADAALKSIRHRTSKACPSCGATVPREANFCQNCGSSLFVPDSASSGQQDDVAHDDDKSDAHIPDEIPVSTPVYEEEELRVEGGDAGDDERLAQQFDFASPQEEYYSQDFEDGAESIYDSDQEVSPGRPKVFVRTSSKKRGRNDDRRGMGYDVDPDESYSEFSHYARRRKRGSGSAVKRLFGTVFLLAAIGGAAWFLLGLRKLDPNDPKIKAALDPSTPPSVQTSAGASRGGSGEIAVPVVTKDPSRLPQFTPNLTPKRGVVTGSNVNVRADHSTGSRVVTKLTNATVDVLESWGSGSSLWYKIRLSGGDGWISGRYLQPIADSQLPSGYTNALLLSFGTDRQAMTDTLGSPVRTNASGIMEWRGVSAAAGAEGEIIRLTVSNANNRLRNGIRGGMSRDELIRIMGYPSSVANGQFRYNEANRVGVSVQFDKNGSVSSATVSRIP